MDKADEGGSGFLVARVNHSGLLPLWLKGVTAKRLRIDKG
jgi:hypothetical protein